MRLTRRGLRGLKGSGLARRISCGLLRTTRNRSQDMTGQMLRYFFATGLAAFALWIAIPGRNVQGNPSMEDEIDRCTTTSGTTFRLYRGNGGATTSFWYTLTSEHGIFSREKQIVFSYDSPEFRSVSCTNDQTIIAGPKTTIRFGTSDLAAMRNTPMSYWPIRQNDAYSGIDLLSIIRYWSAVLLFLWAYKLVFRNWKSRKYSSREDHKP